MKVPRKPPDPDNLKKILTDDPGRFVRLATSNVGMTIDGRYLHWNKFRFHQPPEGFSPEEWWHAVRMKRATSARPIPLRSVTNQPFSYNLVDPIPERLHQIDSLTHGIVEISNVVTNKETKQRYLMHSLIEEAITSSQLEGASTTRNVAKEMIRQGRPPRDRSERMIFNNFRTMQKIGELRGEAIDRRLLMEIHRIVTEETLDDATGAGRLPRKGEDICVADEEGRVFHQPPEAGTLENRLEQMCQFANAEPPSEFIHPVIRSIILHFWLAYDHPFIDGNGRTARALFYWSMLRRGYWLFEFISISEIILKAPVRYGMAFLYTETDREDLTYFLLYHTDVIGRAIARLNAYIQEKTESIRGAEANLRGLSLLNHRQRALISHALRHPGQRYTFASHATSHQVVYQTARTDLLELAKLGLLSQHKQSKALYFVPTPDIEERLRKLA